MSLNAQTLAERIDREIPSLLDTYRALHAAPELSMQEQKTAAVVASRLRQLGYEVTERVGKYGDASATCYGVVAVMRNGKGPVVLLRTDMDALPVTEQTGLPYASTNANVMHACGHDLHMTAFLGTATMLADLKSRWHGTVVLIGQPAEEVVKGAEAMLRDGLYERFPKPDYALAIHDWAVLEAGKVGIRPGYVMANGDSVDIIVRGISGHGASPQSTKDPVVIASEIVMTLQTIVSRESSPLDPVIITVGSIHGGTKRNIIPDEVKLQLTVRTYKPEVRQRVLASIERVAKGIAQAAGLPDDRMPIVNILTDESTPATYNDPVLTQRMSAAVARQIGEKNIVEIDPVMVSEDFARYSLDHRIPATLLLIGAADPAKVASGAPLPSLHSSKFAPAPVDLVLRRAIESEVAMAMDLLR
ncbi:MAG TPA: amidohydrolase [Thermoanaerobaculia bacterium]|nr:amidohydrolase [Thermoanaerobaculia bacterium]